MNEKKITSENFGINVNVKIACKNEGLATSLALIMDIVFMQTFDRIMQTSGIPVQTIRKDLEGTQILITYEKE